MTVRVRIAPSPTGDPHVGTAYIALFNMIYARHFNGKFVLRVEDTDQTRSHPDYETNILDALKWCKIEWDEGPDIGGKYGPYRQSERTEIYQKYVQKLIEKEMAYKCFATAKELAEMRETARVKGKNFGYDRRYRNLSPEEVKKREDAGEPYVIRLKIPLTGECFFEDAIKGRITAPWADIDDQVLLKSDGYPTYHLANVVDDYLMKITHVIRGDEWMTSTPKHIFLYEAFGWKPPVFMHMPLLLGKDSKKLSKRKNPTSIFYFRDSGYLSEALVNFLTLMGYSMPGDKEIYELEEIIEEFDPKRIGVSGAFFDVQKLNWMNQKRMIEKIPEDKLWERLQEWQLNDAFMKKIIPLIHKRIKTFGDFFDLCDFLFINDVKTTKEMLCAKNTPPESIALLLQTIVWILDEKGNWSGEALEETSRECEEIFGLHHKKIILPALFASIMGKLQGPSLFASVTLLGKDRTRVRLMNAIEILGGVSNKKLSQLKKCWGKKDCREMVNQKALQ